MFLFKPILDPRCDKNVDEFATEFKEARYKCGLLAITNVLQNHMESGLRLSQVQDLLNFQRKLYTSFKERLITASKRDVELFLSGNMMLVTFKKCMYYARVYIWNTYIGN